MPDHYPVTVISCDPAAKSGAASMDSAVAALTAGITAAQPGGTSASWLPAVVILASADDSAPVLDLLARLRDAALPIRPRIWPAFVAGTPGSLTDFDAALDEAGSGSCDLVLTVVGAPSAADQAGALGAWLHVKMPAPASVLGELPDSEGRVCRYVALGTAAVEAPSPASSGTAELADVDTARLAAAVIDDLEEAASQEAAVANARSAADALSAACTAADPSAILKREQTFSAALADVLRVLPSTLDSQIGSQVSRELDIQLGKVVDLRDGMPAASATAEAALFGAAVSVPADRSEALREIVLLASKGGLSKMFGKGKLNAAADAVSRAASDDLQSVISKVIAEAAARVPSEIDAQLTARQVRHAADQQRISADAADQERANWGFSIEKARSRAEIWTPIKTAGIRRAWGGPIPSPRRYLVGSAAIVGGIEDRDDTMTVIDLRPGAATASAPQILIAQYALPLAALQ